LILSVIVGAAEFVSSIPSDTRVMAGSDGLGAKRLGLAQKRAELDLLVADDAGIGRATALVFGGEIIHDLAPERVDLVDDVIRDVQRVRDHAGVRHGLRSAAFILFDGPTILRPPTERESNDVVTF